MSVIKVLIVDDLQETRQSVSKMLQFDGEVEVIAEAGNGVEAVKLATELQPDVILMDVNMPEMDGIAATKQISRQVPMAQIIIMSVQSDTPYMRKAMLAGARDFLMKPFSLDELHRAVKEAYERRPVSVAPIDSPAGRAALNGEAGAVPSGGVGSPVRVGQGQIIAIYSPKGGIGCSTIAINTAVSLANAGKNVALLDGNLQFGSIAVMLNLKQTTTILDLIDRIEDIEPDLVRSVAISHDSGLQAILAPQKPEMADLVTEEHLAKLLNILRQVYEFVIVDTQSALDGKTLVMLDQADKMLLVTDQELPSLKTSRDFLNLMGELDYSSEKVNLAINKNLRKGRISAKDVTNILKRPVVYTIPFDLDSARISAEQGKPLVSGNLKNKPISSAFRSISERLIMEASGEEVEIAEEQSKKKGILAKLFRR